MGQLPEHEWADLGESWQKPHADMALFEEELRVRLRRQRLMTTVLKGAEPLSLGVVLGAAAWMSRTWRVEPGASPVLILLLLLPTCMVLGQRWRQRALDTDRGLEGIDRTILREERLLESLRLGSVMSYLALAAMIMMVLVHLYHHSLFISLEAVVSFSLMYLYVFGLQIALMIWGRRLSRRRRTWQAVRNALHPPE